LPVQNSLDRNGNGKVDDGDWDYPVGEVTYRAVNHTNELVTLQARGKGANLFDNYAGTWYLGTDIVDDTQIYQTMVDAVKAGTKHVILFIGDGMNMQPEIAGSRYLYGVDDGLAWDHWGELTDGWAGYASTWDVTTYDKFAVSLGKAKYVLPATPATLGTNDQLIGFNPGMRRAGGVDFRLAK